MTKLSVDEYRLCKLVQAISVRHTAAKNQLQDARRVLHAGGPSRRRSAQPVGDTAVSGPAVSCLRRSLQR